MFYYYLWMSIYEIDIAHLQFNYSEALPENRSSQKGKSQVVYSCLYISFYFMNLAELRDATADKKEMERLDQDGR